MITPFNPDPSGTVNRTEPECASGSGGTVVAPPTPPELTISFPAADTDVMVITKDDETAPAAIQSELAHVFHKITLMELTKGKHVQVLIANLGTSGRGGSAMVIHRTATGGSTTTLVDATADWPENFFVIGDKNLYIVSGTGAGNFLTVLSNTSTTLTFAAQAFTVDATSEFLLFVTANDDNTDETARINNSYTYLVPESTEYEIWSWTNSVTGIGVATQAIDISTDEDAIILDGYLIGIALDTTRNKLFVATYDKVSFESAIQRFDVTTLARDFKTVLATIPHQDSNAIAYAPTTDRIYWVGRFKEGTEKRVYAIDPTDGSIDDTLDILATTGDNFFGPRNVVFYAVAGTNGKLVLTGTKASGVDKRAYVIDLDTFTVDGDVAVTGWYATYISADDRVWIHHAADNASISVFDPVGLDVEQSIGANSRAFQICYDSDKQRVICGIEAVGGNDPGIEEINPSGYAVVEVGNLSQDNPTVAAFRDSDDTTWVCARSESYFMDSLFQYDASDNSQPVFLRTGLNTQRIEVHQASGKMFGACYGTNCIVVMNP